ncbi:hypothetical protein MTR67_025259 [Solanum verrucosum]|uniref:Uncharacterized protein n=1 Tax=Solanum verrucosum TaxID=315347 RepID=A0AAF0QWW3_SOLVR|nr:hypothetical protein MTR67_025259 [Solanum verrucosum]
MLLYTEESTTDKHQGRLPTTRPLEGGDHGMLHTPGCQKFTSFSGPLLVLLTWKVQKYNVTNIYASHGLLIKGRGVTIPSPSLLFADRLLGYFAVSPLHLVRTPLFLL